ncbi:hypothetical protein [Frankia sp. EAN1pec]
MLLAQYGVKCLVLDRWKPIYPQPTGGAPRR